MTLPITGGCLCRAVRFQFSAAPVATRLCWCRDCQYLAAGNATVNVLFPTDSLSVTGATAEFVSTADSGNTMRKRFCPACGTPLFSESSGRPHLLVVRAGALDDPGAVAPGGTIWTGSAPGWAHIDTRLPYWPAQPPPR